MRSLSKEDEKYGVKFGKRARGPAPQNKRVVRGASLENEYSEFDERDDIDDVGPDDVDADDVDVEARMRKSDLQEDSDGLWGDDEDDDFRK